MSPWLIVSETEIMRQRALEISESGTVTQILNLSDMQAETASTLFLDGIISAGLISLQQQGFDVQNLSDKYLYINISEKTNIPLRLDGKILILDAETDDPTVFSHCLKSNFQFFSSIDIKKIIAGSCYVPALLCGLDAKIEVGKHIRPLLWTECDLPNKKLKPTSVVQNLIKKQQI